MRGVLTSLSIANCKAEKGERGEARRGEASLPLSLPSFLLLLSFMGEEKDATCIISSLRLFLLGKFPDLDAAHGGDDVYGTDALRIFVNVR